MNIVLNLLFPQTALERQAECLSPEKLSGKLFIRPIGENPSVIALFSYKDTAIRNLIWILKYKKNARAKRLFAEILYSVVLEELGDTFFFEENKKPLLVPIPLSKKRLRERGYNQMELVARKLAARDENNSFELAANALIKTKETPPQTSLKRREERIKNVVGVFSVRDRESISGRTVILLDDVVTTGSTLREAQNVLLQNGAQKVYSIALAH